MKTSAYNELVPLYAAVAALPAPANKTDLTAGVVFPLESKAFAGTSASRFHEILIESSLASATLTDVKILVMIQGWWRYLADFPSGRIVFPTLDIGLIPVAFTVQDIGRAERLAIEATISGGTVNAWIQQLEANR